MAYVLKRRRPTAHMSYNSFRAVTRIVELAGGDKDKAEDLLSKMYYKVVTVAAADPGRVVSVFPPAEGLWSWNRSFDIACDVASQCADAEIPLAVPEEANIFIGKDILDMDEDEVEDEFADLDFAFDEHLGEDDGMSDALSDFLDTGSDKPKWLGDFGGDLEKIMQQKQLEKLTDANGVELEVPKERPAWEQEAEDIADIISTTPQETFADFLNEKMRERNLKPAQLARKANMMTSTLVKLRNAENPVPTKSQILALGVALELPREEFEHLMELSGYCFSECVVRDRIVSYYLDKGIYALEQINRALFVNEIPTLGTHAPVAK